MNSVHQNAGVFYDDRISGPAETAQLPVRHKKSAVGRWQKACGSDCALAAWSRQGREGVYSRHFDV